MPGILLSGVPKVSFYDPKSGKSPEDIPFPSSLAAAVHYLGRRFGEIPQPKGASLNYAYTLILAASGMAFGLRWKEGWHPDNADQLLIADPDEIIRRAFGAVGYRYRLVSREGNPDGPGTEADEARFRAEIIESLQRGVPVLAFGVIGPPECCIIAGHDDDALIGWNFFAHVPPWDAGVAFEPNGMFRKQAWFPETHSLLLIGDPVEPAFDLIDTLRWAVTVARQPSIWGDASGHAAYDAWTEQLTEEFGGLSDSEIRERHLAHDNLVGILAECRFYGSEFLRHQSREQPEPTATLLRQAADCFQAEHDIMWQVWNSAGGNGSPNGWAHFSKPEVRKAIGGLIREAQAKNRLGIDLLSQWIPV